MKFISIIISELYISKKIIKMDARNASILKRHCKLGVFARVTI